MTKPERHFYEFGSFKVDVVNRLLLRDGEPLPLTPKAVETLIVLIERSGEVLSREDLMELVWPDSAVEDANLTQNIYLLRKYLGKAPDGLGCIETLPRRGYRFVGQVSIVKGPSIGAPGIQQPKNEAAKDGRAEGADQVVTKGHVRGPLKDRQARQPEDSDRRRWAGRLIDLAALLLLACGGMLSLKTSTAPSRFGGNGKDSATRLPAKMQGAISENAEAYEAYRQGCYYLDNQTTRILESSIVHFQQAATIDPNFAAAYAGIAECYVQLASRYNTTADQRAEAVLRARQAADRALQLNNKVPEGHAALGAVRLYLDADFAAAELEFKQAIELNPGYAHGHHAYAILLFTTGRLEQAESEITRAAELDPRSVSVAKNMADGYYFVRQFDQAIDQYRRAAELNPADAQVYRDLGWAYACAGMEAEAMTEFIHAMTLQNANPDLVGMVRRAYERGGLRAFWRKWLEFQQGRIRSGRLDPSYIALVHAFLGDRKEALAWLDRASRDGSIDPTTLKFEPVFDSLRSDSRYQAILSSAGLR
jgi:DNA-binding winged helix-turn-helix (wHTH) protein/Flp pilus assembly protein TadD